MQSHAHRGETPPVLVTGGTGTLGRHVVRGLREAGRAVRVMARTEAETEHDVEFITGDLETAEGLEAAVEGIKVIVHCAGSQKGDGRMATNLVREAARTGVRHLVNISVVGADRVPVKSGIDRAMFGYFEQKLSAEQTIAASGIPWTTLRATQFFDLTLRTAQAMAKLPVIPVPAGFRFQPIETGEVAARLVELALASPAGLVSDLGGPRAYPMADLVRGYLRASGKRRLLLPIWLPGRAARAFRAGANLTPDGAVGRRTWEDFLADRSSTVMAHQTDLLNSV